MAKSSGAFPEVIRNAVPGSGRPPLPMRSAVCISSRRSWVRTDSFQSESTHTLPCCCSHAASCFSGSSWTREKSAFILTPSRLREDQRNQAHRQELNKLLVEVGDPRAREGARERADLVARLACGEDQW